MGCLPYFKLYAQDWLVGVMDLTLEERGAYMTLLAWSWENGPVPSELPGIARILSVTPAKVKKLWVALDVHWQVTGVGLVNERLEEERAKLAEKHEGLSEAGKRGAERRWAAYRLANGHPIGEGR